MSKNRYGKVQGNMQYNRPSGGYQKNLYRQQMLANNVKKPKQLNQKQYRIAMIVIGVILIAASVALTATLKWKGLLISLVLIALAVGGVWLYLRHTQNEMIKYYKQIGMTEEMYLNELKKRGTDMKQVRAASRAWKKVKAEPIMEDPRNKKKK